MARLLMNLLLMQRGYPPVVVRAESKGDYLLALERADAGELDDFVQLIAVNLLRSCEFVLAGARGETIDDLRDWQDRAARLQEQLADDQPQGLPINHS